MTHIELAPEILEDFDRIFDHLAAHGAQEISGRILEIVDAIGILAQHPMIGRPADAQRRELVIGRDSRGHIALYSYVQAIDTVFVLAIRSQREAGWSRH